MRTFGFESISQSYNNGNICARNFVIALFYEWYLGACILSKYYAFYEYFTLKLRRTHKAFQYMDNDYG